MANQGMNMQDMIKNQMLTMGMMNQKDDDDGNSNGFLKIVYGLILMQTVDAVTKAIPVIISSIKNYTNAKLELKRKQYETKLFNPEKKTSSSIIFDVNEGNSIENMTIQAVIDYMCNQNSTIKLRFSTSYVANNLEIFELGYEDVKCKIKEIVFDDKGVLKTMIFEIFSCKLQLKELKYWVDNITSDFSILKKNQLGDKKYYFNEMPIYPIRDNDGSYKMDTSVKNLMFKMTEFNTNKSLDNIFGEEIKPVKRMVDLFTNNKQWYEKRGIPHTLGLLLYGPPGTGKCLGKDTPIIMYNGKIKMVQDIKIGDQLMGDNSKPRNVLGTTVGKETLYKIKQVKGDDYIVNESHILSLRLSCTGTGCNYRYINDNKYQKNDIIDIPVKEYLKLSKNVQEKLKGYKVKVEFPEKKVPFDPYLLGLWLGDGTSSKTDITNQDSSIIKYLIEKLPEYKCHLFYSGDGYTYRINADKITFHFIRRELKELNVFNNKHIPHSFLCNSRKNQLSLLAGLIDSDGWYDKKGKGYEIVQKNKVLSDNILFLCRSLGFGAYQKECEKSCKTKNGKFTGTYYRIHFSGENIEKIPCLVPRKQAEPRKHKKNVLNTGIKIENMSIDNFYGFELDGNHRFLLGDFTVTHNTSTIKAVAKDTNKHIINISLRETTTQTQLSNLFFDENIRVINSSGNTITYCIPLNKRIYILEDIDCLTDIVLSRTEEQPEESESEEEEQPEGGGTPVNNLISPSNVYSNNVFSSQSEILGNGNKGSKKGNKNKDNDNDCVNLSYLLNLLDGVLETPERLLIMTSNHPEKLDPALIRPGRIDLVIKFGKCTNITLSQMFNYFFETEKGKYLFDESCSDILTPAEVTQVLGSNYTDKDKAYTELKIKINEKPDLEKEKKEKLEKEKFEKEQLEKLEREKIEKEKLEKLEKEKLEKIEKEKLEKIEKEKLEKIEKEKLEKLEKEKLEKIEKEKLEKIEKEKLEKIEEKLKDLEKDENTNLNLGPCFGFGSNYTTDKDKAYTGLKIKT
jgi:hypothetical protein